MPTGIFSTWDHQFIDNEKAVTDRIKKNPRYPFKEEGNCKTSPTRLITSDVCISLHIAYVVHHKLFNFILT